MSEKTINGVRFTGPVRVEPMRTKNGMPCEFLPQVHYAKRNVRRLNRHGRGPFCRFKTRDLPHVLGLYALAVDDEVVYAGKADDLASRWGSQGYASISPANCFVGGQSTNCRINHEILLATQAGSMIEVWFRQEPDAARAERDLIRRLNPAWNIQVP